MLDDCRFATSLSASATWTKRRPSTEDGGWTWCLRRRISGEPFDAALNTSRKQKGRVAGGLGAG